MGSEMCIRDSFLTAADDRREFAVWSSMPRGRDRRSTEVSRPLATDLDVVSRCPAAVSVVATTHVATDVERDVELRLAFNESVGALTSSCFR